MEVDVGRASLDLQGRKPCSAKRSGYLGLRYCFGLSIPHTAKS